jgi:hypothetical protein
MLSTDLTPQYSPTQWTNSFPILEQFGQADLNAYPTPPRSIFEGDPNSEAVLSIVRSLRRRPF